MASPRPGPIAIAADVVVATSAPPEAIAERQTRRLADLLQAAIGTRFYRRLLHGRDPRATPLAALPVTTKTDVMRHFADRVTDPALALDGLRAFVAEPARVAQRYLGRYWVWESSGSTGEPCIFVQDETAMTVYDMLESTRRHSPRPWVRLVDPLYLGERYAFVGAIDGHFATHVSLQRLRAANPWLAPHWRGFSILQPTRDLVAQLNAFAPSIVGTYPTAATLLADEALAGRLRLRLSEVWTGGETLTPSMRSRVEQAFGCALRNSYGASEFLPIAWECARGRLHVNADWVILEPVDATFRPVAPGQESHTTLLTNLANHVQPLIRFDIGDRILLGAERCPCGCPLPVVQVQGRSDDILVVPDAAGDPVALLPLAISTLLEDRAGIFDFQLEQLGDRVLRLRLGPDVARSPGVAQRCRRLLADFAAAQGASGLRVVVEAVDELPLGRSGKLARIVATPPARAKRASG